MRRLAFAAAAVLLIAGAIVVLPGSDGAEQPVNQSWRAALPVDAEVREATFAGGCFWCIEAVYDERRGVASAVSGYAGGKASTATYDQVLTGETEHREAVRVTYYPSIVAYPELLDLYWRSIDPADAGGQFADRGPQYTTAIYAHTPRQYGLAVASKQELNASGRFDRPVVTKILNVTTFFRAEEEHQNYSRRRTASYEVYERASGRKGFVERVWEESPLG